MDSRLLALPREIRDDIYARLTHDVLFNDDHQLSNTRILVTIKDAPLPQLLLVNRQLYDEYAETTCCSAHIAIDDLGKASPVSKM